MNRIFEFTKRYSKILFAVYMGLVILVLVLKFPTGLVSSNVKVWLDGGDVTRMSPQLKPFDTIVLYVKNVQAVTDWFFKNLACNIIMFIPYGLLTPLFMKKWKYMGIKVAVSAIVTSLSIEIFQYATAFGLCDIDDVILNVAGAILGYAIYKLIHKFVNK